MAEVGQQPYQPFDRQALEATLADAMRSEADTQAAPPEMPAAPPPPRPAGPAPAAAAPNPAAPAVAPKAATPAPAPARGPAPTQGPTPTQAPARAAAPPMVPRLAAPNVNALVARAEVPGRLPNPGAALSGPGGLGAPNALRTPGVTELSGRAVSGLAPTVDPPAPQATIPLRRGGPAGTDAEARPTSPPSQAAPAAERDRPAPVAVIEPWTPHHDDILPVRAAGRRRSLRRGR